MITALTRRGAVVLPLLNGVDAAERLSAGGVPREAIVGGLTFVNAFKAGPGIIQHAGWLERVILGEFSGAVSGRVPEPHTGEHRHDGARRIDNLEARMRASLQSDGPLHKGKS